MKTLTPLISLIVATATLSCNGESKQSQKTDVVYTKIFECSETVENPNAAFSKLSCDKISNLPLTISIQSPLYFTVELEKSSGKVYSEFEELSGGLPLETGPAIEWHLVDGKPKYMVYRLSWGSEEDPFKMTQKLVINLVTDKRICPLATVAANKDKANQKTHELIKTRFSSVDECNDEIENF